MQVIASMPLGEVPHGAHLLADYVAAHPRAMERLEDKAIEALRRRDDELAGRVRHAQQALFSGGEMREQVIDIASFLARRGMGLIGESVEVVAGTEGRHTVLSL